MAGECVVGPSFLTDSFTAARPIRAPWVSWLPPPVHVRALSPRAAWHQPLARLPPVVAPPQVGERPRSLVGGASDPEGALAAALPPGGELYVGTQPATLAAAGVEGAAGLVRREGYEVATRNTETAW